MACKFSDLLSRFGRDQRGNVFILFGATVIPLLLLMGGAIDYSRYARYKTDLANVIDAASLALVRQGADYNEAKATVFIENYVAGLSVSDDYFVVTKIGVVKTENGFIVSADGSMRTLFLPLNNLKKIETDIVAEVVHASNQVELALVLDNTGSMNCGSTVSGSCTGNWSNPGSSSRISGLKTAAHSLVDALMSGQADSDFIKIAVVPFEGAVNIKNASLDYSWLDWADTPRAKYNGANFDELETLVEAGESCVDGGGWGGWGGWGGGRGGGRGGGGSTICETAYDVLSEPVSHKRLFDLLNEEDSRVEWAGCVEMRAEPYDLLDTAPTSANPDTLFVPFFWPDEPDASNDEGNYYTNDYLDDGTSDNGETAQRNTKKYLVSEIDWHRNKLDSSFPYESGPNYGCSRPILPLTGSRSAVEDAIDGMVAYPAMGTFIPTGLVWGWHALTADAPLTEAVGPGHQDYDKTVKAMVVLTDGENSVTGMSNDNDSIFSGYNYTGTSVDGHYRLGSRNASAAKAHLDTKTRALCTNAKNDGIRIYTITFGSIPNAARTLMRNCASVDKGAALYFHAPSNAELKDVFRSIGEDLSEIHLTM